MATENLVVAFTDIVGSTRLAFSSSPDDADQVRRRHFSILRRSITGAGGTEVKNLGDGLMVVFPTASSALSGAVAMQQAVELHNRGLERPVGLRVGMSGGEATEEDGDYFGDPVVEAARLCAACEGGQILVAGIVRAMAGRRLGHRCRVVGSLELKGLPEPLETLEVVWEPASPAADRPVVELPRRLSLRPEAGVVGREFELQMVASALERVIETGGREFVLVSGEAGQGKTTLVAAACRVAFEAGSCVLFGHGEEDLASPYGMFAEALSRYVAQVDAAPLVEQLGSLASELARLMPDLVRRVPDLPPTRATDHDSERYLLFAAAVAFLAQLSAGQPTVLVLDDLQWADQGSLMLLRHLAASEVPMPVLVVGTYRDTELAQADGLREVLGALHRHGRVSRIELTGLDDHGVVSYLEAVAGHALDQPAVELARAVHRETDGNPLFVGQVMRHLSETGAIYQDASGRWAAGTTLDVTALPDSVRDVIGSRVVGLGQQAIRVLGAAAVIGKDFDLDLLALTTGIAEDDLLDILEGARAGALVREVPDGVGQFTFTHALIQRTITEDLGPTRRARTHRAVALALEELCRATPTARIGELARHWSCTGRSEDLGKAIGYARRAADDALAGLAPEDALASYRQALELCREAPGVDPEVELDLGIGLGTAQRQTGHPEFRVTLLETAGRAGDAGDTGRLVASVLANDRGTFSTVDRIDEEKVALLELALARIHPDDPRRALLLATLCSERTVGSPLAERRALADEAMAIATASGDDELVVRVANHVLIPLAVPPMLERSVERSALALELAHRVGDPLLLCTAASGRRFTAACAGDTATMDRCFEIKRPLVEELDQPFLRWVHLLQCATRSLIAGDTDEAEGFASQALQVGSDGGEPDAVVVFGAQMIMVSLWRGTLGHLVPLIEQAITENPGLEVFTAALALAHSEAGRSDEAGRLLDRFGAGGFELPMDVVWLTSMTAYADTATECRHAGAADAMFEQLAPFADQWHYSDISTAGPVSRSLGGLATVLGRFSQAEELFAQALASSRRAGAKFFTARTELALGRMLVERNGPGDRERAAAVLSRARSEGERLGYANVAGGAARALEAMVGVTR